MPTEGAVLVSSNHQSYFDPVIVGLTFNRRLNYLARQTLFRFTLFRWLIDFLDAIPLDRDGLGVSGLKECLRRLRRGEIVLIFPEGTRTRDGNVSPLQPGFIMLARRGTVSLLPVGIDGAFDAWPRTAIVPRLTKIHVAVGNPITPAEIARLDDAQLLAELEQRIRDCHHQARCGRQ
jgi:1-acyl-sn-glycerol-3-phosphate acyltransferase